MTTNTVIEIATSLVTLLKSIVGLFTEPAILPFVGVALLAAVVGTSKKLVPAKKK